MARVVRIGAARVLAQDGEGMANGAFDDVAGTPLDFRTKLRIGDRIRDRSLLPWRGYDHRFVLDGAVAAEVHAPESGRTLVVTTDQPCI